MARRESSIASAASIRSRDRRAAAKKAAADAPWVSRGAVINLLGRELDKAARKSGHGQPFYEVVNEIVDINPFSLKDARQLVLARLDRFDPKAAS